ncbi:MAG TPA: type II toxin-antitoxin system prevent-host-death family antitoxin [Candidatus Tumulicola sp.]
MNIHQAKTHFSNLIERVSSGEDIVIAKAGKPVARLIAFDESGLQDRRLGILGDYLKKDGRYRPFQFGVLEVSSGEEVSRSTGAA